MAKYRHTNLVFHTEILRNAQQNLYIIRNRRADILYNISLIANITKIQTAPLPPPY